MVSLVRMSNVLDKQKQHDILALGRLGWSLLRIEAATGVRRETVCEYLRAGGIPVQGRGRRSEGRVKAAISSTEASTDPPANPAILSEVSTDSTPARAPRASACAIYREVITEALARSRAGHQPRSAVRLTRVNLSLCQLKFGAALARHFICRR